MQPVVHEGFSGGTGGLSNLVFVMGKDQVFAATMDVERGTQILHAHGRAFDMPARAALAKLRIPVDFAIVLFIGFPQGEVASVLALVFIRIDATAGACLQAVHIETAELAVVGKRGESEV